MPSQTLFPASVAVFGLLAGGATHNVTLRADSTVSMAVTGDVKLSDERISFANGITLHLEAPVVRLVNDDGVRTTAAAYRVTTPANPVLLNGNHLLDRGEANFVLVWKTVPIGADVNPVRICISTSAKMALAVFDGSKCQSFEYEAETSSGR